MAVAGLRKSDPEIILDLYPMHDREEVEFLEAIWFHGEGTGGSRWPWFVPEKEIRDYFGEKIALYTIFAGEFAIFPVAEGGGRALREKPDLLTPNDCVAPQAFTPRSWPS